MEGGSLVALEQYFDSSHGSFFSILARGEEKESSGVKVYGNAGLNRTYKQIKWEPVVTLIYLW